MIQLVFYMPKTHVEQVKQAVFAAGAGSLGDYEQCCWQVLGQGQFRPLANSQPFVGEKNKLETVSEYRVEMIIADEKLQAVVAALKASHPYEMPAYHIIKLANL